MKTFPTSAAWCFWILYIRVSLKTTGSSEVVGSADPVVAIAGDDVILPCSLKPSVNAEDMVVKWTRSYLKTENVHLYRDGRDSNVDQFQSYKGRTSMFYDELKNGNVSLKLTRVTLSDPGSYKCFIPRLTSQVKETTVQLFVGAVSQPVISIVGTKGWGVVLKCESGGWYPEPGMEWLDSAGTILPADGPPERHRDSEDLYTLRRHVTVNKTDTNRFTCRVQQLEINHLRETEIHVPDDVFPKSQAGWNVGLIIAAAVGAVAALVGVYMWRKQQIKDSDEELLFLNELNILPGYLEMIRQQMEKVKKQSGSSTDSDEELLFLNELNILSEHLEELITLRDSDEELLYPDALHNLSGHLERIREQRERIIKQRERIREQRGPSTDPHEELLYFNELNILSEHLEKVIKQSEELITLRDSDEELLFLNELRNLIEHLKRIRKQREKVIKQRVPSTDSDEELLFLKKLRNLIGYLDWIRKQRERPVKIIPTPSTSPGGQQTTQTPSQEETESIEGMVTETLLGPEMEMV